MTDAVGTTGMRRIIDGATWLWLSGALLAAAIAAISTGVLQGITYSSLMPLRARLAVGTQIGWLVAMFTLAAVVALTVAIETRPDASRSAIDVIARVSMGFSILVLAGAAYCVWYAIFPSRIGAGFFGNSATQRLEFVSSQITASVLAAAAVAFVRRIFAAQRAVADAEAAAKRPPARWEDLYVDEDS